MTLGTPEKSNEVLLGREVIGTTFKIYLHMLRVKAASEREVYRELNLSSPSLATYHLTKLYELKLVKKDSNGLYHVNPKSFGIMRFFTVTGKWIIPRTFFYFLFFSVMSIYFLIALPQNWNITMFLFSLIPTAINLIETILFYRTLSQS